MAASHPIKFFTSKENHQQGFTLIEILVAMSLLAFGLLAVAMNTVQGLKSKVDTQVHSRAMLVSSLLTEPLNRAIEVNTETFVNQVKTLSSGTSVDNFTIAVRNSTDAAGNDVVQTPVSQLTPPFTLVLDINYQKDNNTALQFASTHVFVPSP
jgi:prepilin-type N-terminal cleavage/methylation domain-containing protein